MRDSSREPKRAVELQEDFTDQVHMHGWHIDHDHEEEAQGSDDPTNKISVTTIHERLS